MKKELKFDTYSMEALKIMEQTNNCLFLTWKWGSWKSSIINYFISKTKKKLALLGTTGISAINIWWQTIHRFFELSVWKYKKRISKEKMDYIKMVNTFIVDEISMCSSELFDKLNYLMQHIMWNDEFMGWKQFIFVWDLYQLPPVIGTEEKEEFFKKYKWSFFFFAETFDIKYFRVIELKQVHRQKDEEFIAMLNSIRDWSGNKTKIVNYLNTRVTKIEDCPKHAILLCSKNDLVDKYNRIKISELPWEVEKVWAMNTWSFVDIKDLPCERVLEFKEEARVMFINNSDYRNNGTLWTIKKIKYDSIVVELDDWFQVDVKKFTRNDYEWEDEEGNPIISGRCIQYPFKIWFATTISKSQWKTFDEIIVDTGWGLWESWQLYVAISRCTSIEWVYIINPIKEKDVKYSFEVRKFLFDNSL